MGREQSATASRGGKAKSEARARAAAQREAQRKREQRRRNLTVGVVVLVVIAVIAGMVAIKLSSGTKSASTQADSGTVSAVPAASLQSVTTVPASAYSAVGPGAAKAIPAKISGPALTKDGKARVVYVGAEYCPYCAAERWSMVTALSRFGTFSNLKQTTSSSQDALPSTQTFSFRDMSYSSPYLSFEAVETATNKIVNNQRQKLRAPTAEQQALFQKYVPSGSIPFVDIANKFLISGAEYDGQVLQGKTFDQIAQAVRDPGSAIGKAVLGAANGATGALCSASGDKAPVCSAPEVKAAEAAIAASKG